MARALALLVLLPSLLLGTPASIAAEFELVLSEDSAVFQETAGALSRELNGRATVRQKLLANGALPQGPRADLTIALGTRALTAALAAQRRPLIAGLVPRQAFEDALEGRERGGVSAVYLDQPLVRHLRLIGLAAPGRSRIGLLLSRQNADLLERAQAEAAALGFVLVPQTLAGAQDIYPALARLLADSDVLLALPDATIYNSGTIHNILLTTFHDQQPVFAFSPAYVKAGALAAVYSTPAQIARQLAELALKALPGAPLPAPQYPREFSVAINPTVARSLGLALEEAEAIQNRLRALERER